jgi:MFS transporter, PPP family, 3-phenylpropionic acid transporter
MWRCCRPVSAYPRPSCLTASVSNTTDLSPGVAVPYWRLSGWYFFYFAFVGCFLPYFSLYLSSVGLDAWRISVVMAMMPLMRMLAPAFWGLLADRLGRRSFLVAAVLAASSLSFFGFLFTDNFYWLMAIMLVMSLFWSASLPLVEALTLGHLRHAAGRYGRIRLWGSIGFIAAVQGVGFLLDWLPLVAILWISLCLLVCAFIGATVIPESEPIAHDPTTEPLRRSLLQPAVIALLLAGFMMSVAHAPLYTFYSLHLVNHDYGKAAIGGLWSLGVMAEIAVFAFMPRLMVLTSLRNVLLICFALAALRFLLIGWATASPFAVVFAQLLHGASFGAHHAASITALNRWFPSRQQGTVQSLFGSISYGAGGVLGGVLSGYGWDAYGAAVTYTGASIAALGGLLLILFGIHSRTSADSLLEKAAVR